MIGHLERADAPKIRLGGREWAIPELAVKQIVRLVPALARLDRLAQAQDCGAVPSEEEIGWIYDVAYVALSRAYPDLAREDFDDLPIRLDEIVAAVPVIARQAGLERAQPREAPPEGEA